MNLLQQVRDRLVAEHGQSIAEHIGVVLVLGAMVAVVAQSDLDLRIERGVSDQNCRVLSDSACEEGGSEDEEGRERGGRGGPRGTAPGEPPSRGELPGGAAPGELPAGGEAAPPGEEGAGPPLPFEDRSERPGETVIVSAAEAEEEPGDGQSPACEEVDIGNGQRITCRDGVPVLDLDGNGVDDDRERDRFRFQEPTDFNDNGVPDAEEPETFGYGIQRLYRPGQPGVLCEPSPDIEGQLNCAPFPELLAHVAERTTVDPGEALGRALRLADAVSSVLAPLKGILQQGVRRAARPVLERLRDLIRGALRRDRPAPGLSTAQRIGIVRDARTRTGNYGLGKATRSEAEQIGRDFVGPGFTRSRSDPRILVSADGLRQYRPPSFKPGLGRTQANFERRFRPEGRFQGNGHLDITDP